MAGKKCGVMGRRVLGILFFAPFLLNSAGDSGHPPVLDPSGLIQILPPLLTPVTTTLLGLPNLLTKARDMKLLVISADGTEPGFAAIRAILGQIGTPYDAVVLTQTNGALP